MIAEPLVYISKLEPTDVGICPVSSRNGTREYDDEIVFALRIQKGSSPPKSVCGCPFSIIQAKKSFSTKFAGHVHMCASTIAAPTK